MNRLHVSPSKKFLSFASMSYELHIESCSRINCSKTANHADFERVHPRNPVLRYPKKLFRSRRKANMSDKFVQFVVFLVSFGSSLDSAACRVASNMTHESCERGRFSVFSTFPSRHSTIIVNEVIYGECECFSWR